MVDLPKGLLCVPLLSLTSMCIFLSLLRCSMLSECPLKGCGADMVPVRLWGVVSLVGRSESLRRVQGNGCPSIEPRSSTKVSARPSSVMRVVRRRESDIVTALLWFECIILLLRYRTRLVRTPWSSFFSVVSQRGMARRNCLRSTMARRLRYTSTRTDESQVPRLITTLSISTPLPNVWCC
jgi:hypothetical protein